MIRYVPILNEPNTDNGRANLKREFSRLLKKGPMHLMKRHGCWLLSAKVMMTEREP